MGVSRCVTPHVSRGVKKAARSPRGRCSSNCSTATGTNAIAAAVRTSITSVSNNNISNVTSASNSTSNSTSSSSSSDGKNSSGSCSSSSKNKSKGGGSTANKGAKGSKHSISSLDHRSMKRLQHDFQHRLDQYMSLLCTGFTPCPASRRLQARLIQEKQRLASRWQARASKDKQHSRTSSDPPRLDTASVPPRNLRKPAGASSGPWEQASRMKGHWTDLMDCVARGSQAQLFTSKSPSFVSIGGDEIVQSNEPTIRNLRKRLGLSKMRSLGEMINEAKAHQKEHKKAQKQKAKKKKKKRWHMVSSSGLSVTGSEADQGPERRRSLRRKPTPLFNASSQTESTGCMCHCSISSASTGVFLKRSTPRSRHTNSGQDVRALSENSSQAQVSQGEEGSTGPARKSPRNTVVSGRGAGPSPQYAGSLRTTPVGGAESGRAASSVEEDLQHYNAVMERCRVLLGTAEPSCDSRCSGIDDRGGHENVPGQEEDEDSGSWTYTSEANKQTRSQPSLDATGSNGSAVNNWGSEDGQGRDRTTNEGRIAVDNGASYTHDDGKKATFAGGGMVDPGRLSNGEVHCMESGLATADDSGRRGRDRIRSTPAECGIGDSPAEKKQGWPEERSASQSTLLTLRAVATVKSKERKRIRSESSLAGCARPHRSPPLSCRSIKRSSSNPMPYSGVVEFGSEAAIKRQLVTRATSAHNARVNKVTFDLDGGDAEIRDLKAGHCASSAATHTKGVCRTLTANDEAAETAAAAAPATTTSTSMIPKSRIRSGKTSGRNRGSGKHGCGGCGGSSTGEILGKRKRAVSHWILGGQHTALRTRHTKPPLVYPDFRLLVNRAIEEAGTITPMRSSRPDTTGTTERCGSAGKRRYQSVRRQRSSVTDVSCSSPRQRPCSQTSWRTVETESGLRATPSDTITMVHHLQQQKQQQQAGFAFPKRPKTGKRIIKTAKSKGKGKKPRRTGDSGSGCEANTSQEAAGLGLARPGKKKAAKRKKRRVRMSDDILGDARAGDAIVNFDAGSGKESVQDCNNDGAAAVSQHRGVAEDAAGDGEDTAVTVSGVGPRGREDARKGGAPPLFSPTFLSSSLSSSSSSSPAGKPRMSWKSSKRVASVAPLSPAATLRLFPTAASNLPASLPAARLQTLAKSSGRLGKLGRASGLAAKPLQYAQNPAATAATAQATLGSEPCLLRYQRQFTSYKGSHLDIRPSSGGDCAEDVSVLRKCCPFVVALLIQFLVHYSSS